MKYKKKFALILVFFLLLLSLNPLMALDLGLMAGAGNISFNSNLGTSLSEENKPFSPFFFPLIRATVSGDAGFVFYEGGFDRSPILRNQLFANIGIDMTYFKMDAGPFIGLFNTKEEIFNPGFSAGMQLQFPGIVFASVRASSTLGGALGTTGSYTQKTGGLSAGFWVPNIICSFNLSSEIFTEKKEANLTAEDSLNRYFFRADIFSKNIPFTVKIDMGYAVLKRSYYSQKIITSGPDQVLVSQTLDDEFKFIYLGFRMTYAIVPAFRIILTGEMPVYSWSTPKMKNPEKGVMLFRAMGGVIVTL